MNAISKETAEDIALAYRGIETAEGLLSEITVSMDRRATPDIRDAFGRRQDGLQLGVPSGSGGHRLFNVPVAIGDASYSIYLFHPLVAYGLGLVRPARIALAAGIGWAMHVLVERRILAGRSRWPAVLKRLNVSTHRVREA